MIIDKEGQMKHETYRKTKQRTRILDILCGTDSHPTANWIYDKLKHEFPSLSLGTVYRNLGILQEQGKIKKLHSGSTFDRYDAVTEPHVHFCCKECGSVYDMNDPVIPDLLQNADQHSNHNIEEINLSYMGVCEKCK